MQFILFAIRFLLKVIFLILKRRSTMCSPYTLITILFFKYNSELENEEKT